MKLVDALISGVAGAEDGHVEFYQRGTTTRATWYSDFEAGTARTGNLTLDSNGRGVAYVDGYTTVKVFDSDGVEQISFVSGSNAGSTETKGQSFTGTDYGKTSSAANLPVQLQTVLDRWLTSGGAVDWNVLVDGASKTLQAAIGAVSGIVYNVKAAEYGALGDDATDDLSAIQAAIDAARTDGVGFVYLPPGKYVVSDTINLSASVSLIGAGPFLTKVKINHASNKTISINSPSGGNRTLISGISFGSKTTNTGSVIGWTNVVFETRLVVYGCWFGYATDGGDGLTATSLMGGSTMLSIAVDNCDYWVSDAGQSCISLTGTDVTTVRDCRFQSNIVGYNDILISANRANVVGCRFDTSNVTANHVGVEIERGVVAYCVFADPSSGVLTCIDVASGVAATGDIVREFGNVFGTDYAKTLPYGTGSTTRYDSFLCATRDTNWLEITDNSATITIPSRQFGKILLNRTVAGAQTVNTETTASAGLGAELWLLLFNDGTGGNITFTWGSEFITAASTEVLADNSRVLCMFVRNDSDWVQANTFVQV